MNKKELVKHYTELLEAKDRQEQWAIDELAKPLKTPEQRGACFQAVCLKRGIKPIPDDHPLYKNAATFVVIGRGSRKKKARH